MAFITPIPLSTTSTFTPATTPHLHHSRLQASQTSFRSVRRSPRMIAVTEDTQSQSAAPSKLPKLYDVIVIGGGPAGLSLASGLATRGVSVLCADFHLHRPWPNNYGTWLDELQPLGLAHCVSHVWHKTGAYVRADGRKSELGRTYVRVDRIKMKQEFLQRCEQSGNVTFVHAAADAVDDSRADCSLVTLTPVTEEGEETQQMTVGGRVVVDATGHSLRFVKFNDGRTPGFQAAYGIECIVDGTNGAFDNDEMMLMDFRDDHMQSTKGERDESHQQPTFVYVMPLDNGKGHHVFFEETSLVASEAMDFELLKKRLYKRLGYYGINVRSVMEEEFCLIPMGGEMPDLRQRVVAFGGAAALVHPATGYMIARALKLADNAADIIVGQLNSSSNADTTAFRIWDRIWNDGRRHQRDFFNFGGEYLQRIDLNTLRDFFAAFFDLPKEQWSGFLSFKLMQPLERLNFGLAVFIRTTNRVRTSIVPMAVMKGGLPLLMSILPLYDVDKEEA